MCVCVWGGGHADYFSAYRHYQPVYTTDREGQIGSSSMQIDLGGAFTVRRASTGEVWGRSS